MRPWRAISVTLSLAAGTASAPGGALCSIRAAMFTAAPIAVLSASTLDAELALGELVQLDVMGFPLIRRWHLVYPRGKRQSPAALAFKAWLFEHRP